MSRLRLNLVGVPSAPPTTTVELFYDTADKKLKLMFEDGRVIAISADGMRDQNILINGGFDYAQRQAPATLTTYSQTAARVYGPDLWALTNETASTQYRRIDTSGAVQSGITARFYGEYSKITAAGKIEVSQTIEGGNCMHLRGRKIRVQMKLKASSAKTLRIALLQLTAAGTIDVVPGIVNAAPSGTFISAHGANSVDPTFGTNLSKIVPDTADNATIVNNGLTCAVTTTWQRFGGSYTLPTDYKNLVVVVFTDSQYSVADNFGITEGGLYDGVEILDWAERMQVTQFLNCQRTYAKSFNADTAPAQNAGLAGAERGHTVAGAVAASFGINFPAMMRAAPSVITFFNPSAANAFVRNVTAATDATVTTAANASEGGVDVNNTGLAAWLAGQPVAVHYAADCSI